MIEVYTENPGPLQCKSLTLHWSYALLGSSRPSWPRRTSRARAPSLANIGAFLGFVGMTTLPGMLVHRLVRLGSIGQVYGVDADRRPGCQEQMAETMWALPFLALPGIIGLLLCTARCGRRALWRAGVVRWWSFAAALAGTATFIGSGVTVWGVSLTAVLFTVLGVALAPRNAVSASLTGPTAPDGDLLVRGRRASGRHPNWSP